MKLFSVVLFSGVFLFGSSTFAQEVIASAESLDLHKAPSLSFDNPSQVCKIFKEAVRSDKKSGDYQQISEKYFALALGLALNGHYKRSIRFHKKAIRIHERFRDDDPLEIELNLGLTYHLAGKTKKAKRILGETI